jgi:hypothetical protein
MLAHRAWRLAALALLAAVASASVLALAGAAGGTPARRTVWLCRPGLAHNPCTSGLTATVVRADGSTRVVRASPARNAPVDCFYVYPTVSRQRTANASMRVDPEERSVAIAQAARFSQVCRVFAPIYPQITLQRLLRPGGISLTNALIAYEGLRSAFRDYLAHWNHGRGIVFVGHSQGAEVLIALLRREVDGNRALRRRLVSAILLGGNVTVARGRDVGGDFAHISACRSRSQTGCVVAYSSFSSRPPAGALFGRVGSGLNPFSSANGASRSRLSVLCVNPAAPAGGTGRLDPYFPIGGLASVLPGVSRATPWVAYPGEYTARCESAGGATWLQVTRAGGNGDKRPSLPASFGGPDWGLHDVDVNIALGNLVALVRAEAAAYGRGGRP